MSTKKQRKTLLLNEDLFDRDEELYDENTPPITPTLVAEVKAEPSINSIEPNVIEGTVETELNIIGKNTQFTEDMPVFIGDKHYKIAKVLSTKILNIIYTPGDLPAGTYNVRVMHGDKELTLNDAFTVKETVEVETPKEETEETPKDTEEIAEKAEGKTEEEIEEYKKLIKEHEKTIEQLKAENADLKKQVKQLKKSKNAAGNDVLKDFKSIFDDEDFIRLYEKRKEMLIKQRESGKRFQVNITLPFDRFVFLDTLEAYANIHYGVKITKPSILQEYILFVNKLPINWHNILPAIQLKGENTGLLIRTELDKIARSYGIQYVEKSKKD